MEFERRGEMHVMDDKGEQEAVDQSLRDLFEHNLQALKSLVAYALSNPLSMPFRAPCSSGERFLMMGVLQSGADTRRPVSRS
jgi:hypothetical protein